MKKDIHPQYKEVTFTCGCGAKYQTRSTVASHNLDICSNCHPFYTGTQRVVDAAGRVDKFKKRYGKS